MITMSSFLRAMSQSLPFGNSVKGLLIHITSGKDSMHLFLVNHNHKVVVYNKVNDSYIPIIMEAPCDLEVEKISELFGYNTFEIRAIRQVLISGVLTEYGKKPISINDGESEFIFIRHVA